jgi:hypothetical protein
VAESIPHGQELRDQLRALDSGERWRLYRVARRGEKEADPRKAALVVALARQQLKQQLVIVAILVAFFVGWPLFVWARNPDPQTGASLLGGIIGFLLVGLPVMWFFARRYKRAERLNLEVASRTPKRKRKGKGTRR